MQTTWREELAWAAGFFDGEGWSGLLEGKTGKLHARMAIHQVHLPSLERFHRAVLGLGQINGPYANGRNQPIHKWQATNWAAVQGIGVMLLPFLGAEKTAQWMDVMQRADKPPVRLTGKCGRGHDQAKYRTKWGQCRECMRLKKAEARAAA